MTKGINNRSSIAASNLDKLPRLDSLLEGTAHLVWREVYRGIGGSDVLLDCLDTGAVALLEGLDSHEHHLHNRGGKPWGGYEHGLLVRDL